MERLAHTQKRLWVIGHAVLFGLYRMRVRLILITLVELLLLLGLGAHQGYYGQEYMPGVHTVPIVWIVLLLMPVSIIGDMPRQLLFYYYPRFLRMGRFAAMLISIATGLLANVIPMVAVLLQLGPANWMFTGYLVLVSCCISAAAMVLVLIISPVWVQAGWLLILIVSGLTQLQTPVTMLMLARFNSAAVLSNLLMVLLLTLILVGLVWWYLRQVDYVIGDSKW